MSAVEMPTEVPVESMEIVQRTELHRLPALMSKTEFEDAWRVANALALSGRFKDATQPAEAFAKILLGRELGLSAPQSMVGLYLFDGGCQVAYPMLGNFIRSRDSYDYEVVEHTNEKCVLEFFIDGKSRGVSSFSWEDAVKAKLVNKDTYQKYPRNLLFARAMSNGVKWFMPEVTNGMPVYVEDELPSASRGALTDGSTDAPSTVEPSLSPEFWDEIEQLVGPDARGHLQALTAEWPVAKTEMTLKGRDAVDLMDLLAGYAEEVTAEPVKEDEVRLNENADRAEDAGNGGDQLDESVSVNRTEIDALRHRLLDLEIEQDSLGEVESERAIVVRQQIAVIMEQMADLQAGG